MNQVKEIFKALILIFILLFGLSCTYLSIKAESILIKMIFAIPAIMIFLFGSVDYWIDKINQLFRK